MESPVRQLLRRMATDLEIVEASLDDVVHAAAIVRLLDGYAREPMGIGRPLPDEVKARLIDGLREQGNAFVLLAFMGKEPVGIAVCFRGFSTFAARPVMNVHDLSVRPGFRGRRIGLELLRRVEARAHAIGCSKVTLEVREDNDSALRLYRRAGFVGDEALEHRPRTLFLEKELPD